MELLSVENLVFVLPLALAVVLVVLMALGLPFGDEGLDIGADMSTDISSVADAAHVPDMHTHIHATGGLHAILGFFGIGKVPFMLILVSFCMIWGGSGLAIRFLNVEWSLLNRCLLAGILAIASTKLLAATMGRLLPSIETYGVPAADLLSEYAEVIHDVTTDGGTVRLVDSEGNLRDLACRIAPTPTSGDQSQTAPAQHFKRGDRVMLTAYDEERDIYLAVAAEATPGGSGASGTEAQRAN